MLLSAQALLLWSGIAQSVPCNCDHFLIHCNSHLSYNHSQFIHQRSLLWSQQRHLVAKRGETDSWILCISISISIMPQGNFNMPLYLTTWGRRLYFRSEGSRATDFYPVKINRSRPGLNPKTLRSNCKHHTLKPPRTTKSRVTINMMRNV
jgi:hypothetical protein